MTDNIKKALELLKNDPVLLEKATKVKDIEGLIQIAKEHGLSLNKEDIKNAKVSFNGKQKMNTEELEKVSGAGIAKQCFCTIGGGGNGDVYKYTCGCAIYGQGNYDGKAVCTCVIGGVGYDNGYKPGC